MRTKLLIPIILGSIALTVMVGAFLLNSSPYVSVAEAKSLSGRTVHLAGEMIPGTFKMDPSNSTSRFTIKDEKGQIANVIYKGAQPSNMGSVTRVVAIGSMKGDDFVADQLQTKCPSKYESDSKPSPPLAPSKL